MLAHSVKMPNPYLMFELCYGYVTSWEAKKGRIKFHVQTTGAVGDDNYRWADGRSEEIDKLVHMRVSPFLYARGW